MNSISVLILASLMAFSVATFNADSGQIGSSENISGPNGPAPNSGDGDPDGSGNDGSFGPGNGNGPAPNSGDGDPDGSGNDAPFEP